MADDVQVNKKLTPYIDIWQDTFTQIYEPGTYKTFLLSWKIVVVVVVPLLAVLRIT